MKNKLFYLAVVPALFFQLIGAYLYLDLYQGEDFSQIIYYITKVTLVAWPLLWLYFARSRFLPFLGGKHGKSVVLGFFSGLGIVAVVAIFYLLFSDYFAQFSANLVDAAEGLGFLENYILFAFFLSVIHSFIEEYYWRWFVLNGLMLKFGKTASVVISSLAFASHHFIVVMMFVPLHFALIATFVIFLVGMYWSNLYLRTKSLAGPWLSHFFADAVVMTAGYFLIF